MNNKFSEYYVVKASELDLTDKTKEEIKELYSVYFNELEELTDRVREETNFEGSLIALTAVREKIEYVKSENSVEVLMIQHTNGLYTDLEDLIKNSNLYEIFKGLIIKLIKRGKQEEK